MTNPAENVLVMQGITKKFPGVIANNGVNFEIQAGEVHALLGENGAGKSTLMNVLCGLYQPDAGTIIWKGQSVQIDSPRQAALNRIGMVHQDFKLIQRMTVAENMMLGRPFSHQVYFDLGKAVEEVKQVSTDFGLPIDPCIPVKQLSAGMQQRVAILKVLSGSPDLVIFDEPTSVLTPKEAESLFRMMQSLIINGKSICFITHKLEEVMNIATRVTVLRDGKAIDTLDVKQTNPREMARLMVGREVFFTIDKEECQPGDVSLDVQNISTPAEQGQVALNDISFKVREGEILGIAGISGNGQNELAEAISGLCPVLSGSIEIRGKDITHMLPKEIIEQGVAYIPDNVRQNAVFMELDLQHNMIAKSQRRAPLAHRGIFRMRVIEKYVRRLIDKYNIQAPSQKTLARQLSGGNLQRMVLARETSRDLNLIIAANPIAGLDVGAAEYVHEQLLLQRQLGRAILLISADLDELFSMCDRIAVLYQGRIVNIFEASRTNLEEIGLLMGGGANNLQDPTNEQCE